MKKYFDPKGWRPFAVVALLSALLTAPTRLNAQISLGVCTSIKNAQKIKDAGGDYIEVSVSNFLVPLRSDAEFADNLAAAFASPVPIRACNSFFPGSIKLTGPQRDFDTALAYSEVVFRRAEQTGIECIVLGSSGARNYPEGYDKAKAVAEFTELLKKMGPLAAEHGVVVVLEPLSKGEANFMNTVAEGVAIVKEVNHPNIRCLADIYHMMSEDEGPGVLLDEKEYIYHIHVAEKQGRAVPGTHGEDLTYYYNTLKQAGYKGGMSIEANWSNFDTQIAPALTGLRELTK
jgi:sugar phosphate isomerase/epimerase